jgi:gliding motility-associated-like protein
MGEEIGGEVRRAASLDVFFMKQYFLHIFLLTSFFFFKDHSLNAQNLFHQDIFYGGVTAGGFSSGQGFGDGALNLYIEPGSTIRRAYLFSYRIGFPPSVPITVNNHPYLFDTLNCVMSVHHTNPYANPIKLYYCDITEDLVLSPTTSFNISIPNQFGLPINWGWWTAFLYVEYDNPTLSKIATSIWINKQDYIGYENYSMLGMNPINTSNPVGLSLMLDRGCNNTTDSKIVNVNGNTLGTIGIADAVNPFFNCAGSKGHFYYQNDFLFGLDDDSSDLSMSGADALADISSIMSNGSTEYTLNLTHTNPHPAPNQPQFNLLFFNAYTTPCDTFSTSIIADTVICKGDSIELFASGGTNYYWQDPTSLNNPNIANPVASPDSSMLYIVRIENALGCTRTEKVCVKVNDNPKITDISIIASVCGNDNGQVTIVGSGVNTLQYSIGSGFQNINHFSNLSSGNYTIVLKDNNGCSSDTTLFIPQINQVNASFSANPQTGPNPLLVEFTNLSIGSNHYIWYVDSNYLSNDINESQYFTNAGTYSVSLIAYNNNPQCADTFSLQISVFDSLMIQIPNVITPNDDDVNDVFSVTINGAKEIQCTIVNRWGNIVYEYDAQIPVNPVVLDLWDGKLKDEKVVSDGVYFYVMELKDMNNDKHKLNGFFHVIKY